MLANKWAKVYMVGTVVLSISVVGLIVSGENKGSLWLVPMILATITCIFARWKIRRDRLER